MKDGVGLAGLDRSYLDAWLVGTQEPKSQELLGAAAKKFGLSVGALPVTKQAQAALEALYALTQVTLKEMGVEKIKLYRGLEEANGVGRGRWKEGPLSSWTPLKEMAAAHAQGPQGCIISTVVERESIVGFYGTWMGSGYTREYVIRGGEMEIEVEGLDAKRAPYAGGVPGTMAVPDGCIRLYHYTGAGSLGSIWEQGLLKSVARGVDYDEPPVVWGSTRMPKPNSLNFVEFYVKPKAIDVGHPRFGGQPLTQAEIDEFQSGDHDVTLFGNVVPEQILDVHEPWHEALRYLEADADYFSQDMVEHPQVYEPHGDKRLDPAIAAFKSRHGLDQVEPQLPEMALGVE